MRTAAITILATIGAAEMIEHAFHVVHWVGVLVQQCK